jgi:RNA polymerase sigma-70 factor, ECF subfamily
VDYETVVDQNIVLNHDTSDAEHLLAMSLSGNRAALDELFGPCIPKLRRTADRMFGNFADSEDAVQDALLSAYVHLGRFQGRAKFSSWLHSIVINVGRTYLRKRRSRPTVSITEIPGELVFEAILTDRQPNPEEHYGKRERLRIVAEELQYMPEEYREVLFQCDIKGRALKEVAARLDIPVGTLKCRLHRGRRLILKRLGERVCSKNRIRV